MKVVSRVSVEGLRELSHNLSELPKSTARGVLKRVLMKRGQPIADTMRSLAPDNPYTKKDLKSSIAVGTKLSKRQARLHRKATKDDKDFAEVFVGAGAVPQAHLQEWGTVHHGPQPFARPAWDQHNKTLLDGIRTDLWDSISKATARMRLKVLKGK